MGDAVSRRELLALVSSMAIGVPLAAAMVGCEASSPPPGTMATNTELETISLSGVLDIDDDAVNEIVASARPRLFSISGDGHSHVVPVNPRAAQVLRVTGGVVVRSGPAPSDGHSHWIRVRIQRA